MEGEKEEKEEENDKEEEEEEKEEENEDEKEKEREKKKRTICITIGCQGSRWGCYTSCLQVIDQNVLLYIPGSRMSPFILSKQYKWTGKNGIDSSLLCTKCHRLHIDVFIDLPSQQITPTLTQIMFLNYKAWSLLHVAQADNMQINKSCTMTNHQWYNFTYDSWQIKTLWYWNHTTLGKNVNTITVEGLTPCVVCITSGPFY